MGYLRVSCYIVQLQCTSCSGKARLTGGAAATLFSAFFPVDWSAVWTDKICRWTKGHSCSPLHSKGHILSSRKFLHSQTITDIWYGSGTRKPFLISDHILIKLIGQFPELHVSTRVKNKADKIAEGPSLFTCLRLKGCDVYGSLPLLNMVKHLCMLDWWSLTFMKFTWN